MKQLFYFIVLLMASAVIAKHVCQPRSHFKDYCNTCICSDDGLSFGCTEMMCDVNLWNPDGSMKNFPESNRYLRSSKVSVLNNIDVNLKNGMELESTQVCTPRSHFKKYCNTCACSDDGSSFICTKMMCDETIWNKNGSIKVLPSSNRVTRSAKQVCRPRTNFYKYCNLCTCSEDGMTFGCTRMMCDTEIWNVDGSLKVDPNSLNSRVTRTTKRVCEPGSQFKDYCNMCACSDDGTTYGCTRMMCDTEVWNQDGTLKIAVDSLNSRLTRSTKKVCKPGSQFKNYCNICACSDDGTTYGCTRMMCDKEIWNSDGSLKEATEPNRVAKSDEKVCNPGKRFNDYCNTCLCSDDGSFYSCTFKYCDKSIWRKDGTMILVPLSNDFSN